MPAVPQLIPPREFYPALRQSIACLCCPFIASAASTVALHGAMDAHARYVNAKADRQSDPHFDDQRLEALILP